jgi:hypothetical protein
MRTLLNDRFAPITSSPGYLKLELDDAVSALATWRRRLSRGRLVSVEEITDPFPECLHRLEPLTGGVRPRELLVEASGGWTAYFDCSLRGTDAVSAIGYLTEAANCQGLAIRCVPHTAGQPGLKHGRMGSVQFEMLGPFKTDFLNYIRTVSASFDGNWVFDVFGTPQDFEELDAYRAPRARDRFTSEMLERYCKALGLDVFNPQAYGPRAVLVRSEVEVPPNGKVMTLHEVQRWLEIVPEVPAKLPN